MNLTNNTILITGGSSGIGFQLAKTLHQLGNRILVTGRDAQKLAFVQSLCSGIQTIQCDISQQEELDRLMVVVEQNYGDLNMLVNNAAVQYNYDFMTEGNLINKIDYEVSTNLISTIKLCGLLLPVLQKQEHAAIVNVSSGLAITPKKTAPVYCATKAAIHSFTKALRYQLAPHGIRVFEIIPPLVDTPMTEGRGKGKITPEQLITEFLRDFKNNKTESYIGKSKLLKQINRLWPKLADNIMKNG